MAEARSYAARNRQGSNWFGHDDPASPAPNPATSPVKSPPVSSPTKNGADSGTGRTQMIKPTCNSNQWYKCDGGPTSSPKKEAAAKGQPRQPSGDWYAHGAPPSDDKKESKPRVMTQEGESYCRRDKTGSSAAWFSHEHAKDEAPQVGTGPRVTSKEGCGNATRMRGESENWFSHSPSSPDHEPAHTSKGRGIQQRGGEMHHVFHHAAGDAAGAN